MKRSQSRDTERVATLVCMRFELMDPERVRLSDAGEPVELIGQLALFLRLLLVAGGDTVRKTEIARLLGVREDSVASYAKNLRNKLTDASIVESDATIGYRIAGNHESDLREFTASVSAAERDARGFDVFSLPIDVAKRLLGVLAPTWRGNPATGLEDTSMGQAAYTRFAAIHASQTRLLNMARVASAIKQLSRVRLPISRLPSKPATLSCPTSPHGDTWRSRIFVTVKCCGPNAFFISLTSSMTKWTRCFRPRWQTCASE